MKEFMCFQSLAHEFGNVRLSAMRRQLKRPKGIFVSHFICDVSTSCRVLAARVRCDHYIGSESFHHHKNRASEHIAIQSVSSSMAAQSIFGTNFTFPLEMSQCVKRFDTKAVCRTSDARRPTSIARLLIVNMPLPQQTLATTLKLW